MTGSCGTKCPPLAGCQSDPTDNYTVQGSVMEETAVTGTASRVCYFRCENRSESGNAGSNAASIINIGELEVNGEVADWWFSCHIAGQGVAQLAAPGDCGGPTSAASDGRADLEWVLEFDLLTPATVRLGYGHQVSAEGTAFASSMWRVASDSVTMFDERISTVDGPAGGNGTVERYLPAGRYTLRIDSDASASPGAPVGGDASGVAVVMVQGFLRIRSTGCVPACDADFNCDGQADFFDYLDFVIAFAVEDPRADFNFDGQIDFFDYLDFIVAFAAGC